MGARQGNTGGRIAAVNGPAAGAGIVPGLPLADARAIAPDLHTAEADPAGDRRSLERLAGWCGRYTPWAAVDGGAMEGIGGGLWLDVTGTQHLFGGEEALLGDVTRRLGGFGFQSAAAVADTPGAAWAVARFGIDGKENTAVVPMGGAARAMAPLPVAGLRLPAAAVEGLCRLGLRRIGDLLDLPRGPLTQRFGTIVVERLDQALGRAPEPVSPFLPVPGLRARMAFPEPIGNRDDVARATDRLIDIVCDGLAGAHQGVRRLELALYRVDGTFERATVGTGRPVRDPGHLARLFGEKLDKMDAGFGIEVMVLAVAATDPLPPAQAIFDQEPAPLSEGMARLIDRLGNRFGRKSVFGLEPRASHIPERASRAVPVLAPEKPKPALGIAEMTGNPPSGTRPIHLLPWPEPIEAMAPVPDHPPVVFRWRRRQYRVALADGPERMTPEWWLEAPEMLGSGDERLRDYYRVEDTTGARFWVFREGPYRPGIRPRWFLHGFFP